MKSEKCLILKILALKDQISDLIYNEKISKKDEEKKLINFDIFLLNLQIEVIEEILELKKL